MWLRLQKFTEKIGRIHIMPIVGACKHMVEAAGTLAVLHGMEVDGLSDTCRAEGRRDKI